MALFCHLALLQARAGGVVTLPLGRLALLGSVLLPSRRVASAPRCLQLGVASVRCSEDPVLAGRAADSSTAAVGDLDHAEPGQAVGAARLGSAQRASNC